MLQCDCMHWALVISRLKNKLPSRACQREVKANFGIMLQCGCVGLGVVVSRVHNRSRAWQGRQAA